MAVQPDEVLKDPAMEARGTVLIEDVCVPRSALPSMFAAIDDIAWIDNGPGWVGVDLGTAEAVLDVVPDIAAFTSSTRL